MDQQPKQNQPQDNPKNEQQQNKEDNEIKQPQKPKQPKQPKYMMILRMQTGKDGMNFEQMAKESEQKEYTSKVLKGVLLSQQQ